MSQKEQKRKAIRLAAKDLPLSCPREGVDVWNLHPKVYLPIEEEGEVVCPYCGNHFVLNNASHS